MTAPAYAYDVLVLGGGMAGLVAGARAVQRGGRVLVVEKSTSCGGSAVHAEFIWTAPTFEVLREVNPLGDPALGERLIDRRAEALGWVAELGVTMGPEVELLGFGTGRRTDMGQLLSTLERIVREGPGSDLVLRCEPTRLLRNAGGRVVGAVLRTRDGSTRTVHAGQTVLATGGFAANPELRAELIAPAARHLPLRANPHSDGAGLCLGRDAGAAIGADGAGFYGHLMPAGLTPDPAVGLAAMSFFHSEHGVLINRLGQRFVDETVGDHLNTLALMEQPDQRALLTYDEYVHRNWMLKPYVEGLEPVDKFALSYRHGARAATADALEEFAELPPEWGYPSDAVHSTLLDFNEACGAGGPQPGRRRDSRPLTQPPYYVIEVWPAITFTFTGVRIDAQARVLDRAHRPIQGLLAAGADAGGLYVQAYAGGLAAALVFGLTAAETAVRSLPTAIGALG
jgi:succinate dehydrogenase/fumarate reductase flavoprotein subunit